MTYNKPILKHPKSLPNSNYTKQSYNTQTTHKPNIQTHKTTILTTIILLLYNNLIKKQILNNKNTFIYL